jgi:hypothetical protein
MKSDKLIETIRKNIQSVMNIIMSKLFTTENKILPLQFVRVVEKFDVVERPEYKGWVLRPNSE